MLLLLLLYLAAGRTGDITCERKSNSLSQAAAVGSLLACPAILTHTHKQLVSQSRVGSNAAAAAGACAHTQRIETTQNHNQQQA